MSAAQEGDRSTPCFQVLVCLRAGSKLERAERFWIPSSQSVHPPARWARPARLTGRVHACMHLPGRIPGPRTLFRCHQETDGGRARQPPEALRRNPHLPLHAPPLPLSAAALVEMCGAGGESLQCRMCELARRSSRLLSAPSLPISFSSTRLFGALRVSRPLLFLHFPDAQRGNGPLRAAGGFAAHGGPSGHLRSRADDCSTTPAADSAVDRCRCTPASLEEHPEQVHTHVRHEPPRGATAGVCAPNPPRWLRRIDGPSHGS